jgi:Tol biopolymer transport system component
MPELRSLLEREVERTPIEPFGLEVLERRRDRSRARERAVVIGLVVLLTGISIAFVIKALGGTEPRPAQPVPAPAAAGSLAYALDGDIYVADADGSNAVKIADGRPAKDCDGWGGEYWTEGGLWSPDGRYLAYRRYENCASSSNPRQVVISDAEGNVVATFPAEGWATAWSPDSTRLAVWDSWGETVGVYGLDGVRQTELVIPPGEHGGGDNDPVWMPDGTLTVGNLVVPLDGSAPHKETFEAQPSPDGSLLVYGTRHALMIARSDGSEPRQVFGDRTWGPTPWSPAGDRIAFTSSSGRRPYVTDELRVFDVATGAVTLLAGDESGATYSVVGFSPQGDRILFSKDEGDESSLWSIGVDGSDPRLIVAGTWVGEWLSP